MGNNQSTRGDMIARIGTFLLLMGTFFFIIFLASEFANQPDFDWLFLGILFISLGTMLRRRAAPPTGSGRFGILRKLRERSKKRKEEKARKD